MHPSDRLIFLYEGVFFDVRQISRSLCAALVVLGFLCPLPMAAQSGAKNANNEETPRKIRSTVQPTYPDLARKLNLSGIVKVMVTVSPDGKVKDTTVVGGHPVLADSAVKAITHWRYAPAHERTTEVIEIRFSRP